MDLRTRLTWRQAAQRLGEELAWVGPSGYYALTPQQWLDWCLAALAERGRSSPISLVPCECGCGKLSEHAALEFNHPEDYRDERG